MYDELVKKLRYHRVDRDDIAKAADAIEELCKAKDTLAEQVAYWQAELIRAKCGEYLAELNAPRWIPVEERLPEVGEKVLICHSHEGHKSISICSLRKSFLRDDELGGFIAWSAYTKNVTHWMPLPEPPEREVGHK